MSNNENQENVLRNLTIKLFSEFGAGKDENFCISPLNVYMALSSILCGSKNRTANQLKQFLQLNDLTNEQILALNKNNLLNLAKLNKLNGFKIDLMNRFYYSKKDLSLNTEFIENLQRFYESQIDFIDLNNSQYYRLINDQFANKYGHLIDSNTFDEAKLAQINATSFKGKWLNRFDAKQVYQDDFYLKDGTTVKVNMMQMKNREYLFKINPAGIFARTCTIPYMGETLAMTIILPHDGIDIEQVESQLTSEALKKIMYYSSNMYIGKVNIYLPKFKIDFKTELSDCMKKVGVSLAFDSVKSDLNGFTNGKNDLFLSNLIHKSVVEVDEEGGDPSLVTINVTVRSSAFVFDLPNVFKCNKPFLFLIHDNNKSTTTNNSSDILYMGKFVKPNE